MACDARTFFTYPTAFGPVTIGADGQAVTVVVLGEAALPGTGRATAITTEAANQVMEYLAGKRTAFTVAWAALLDRSAVAWAVCLDFWSIPRCASRWAFFRARPAIRSVAAFFPVGPGALAGAARVRAFTLEAAVADG